MKIQIPDFIGSPPLSRFFLKKMAALKYTRSALSRAVRLFGGNYNHLAIPMHIDLPIDFVFNQNRAEPRGEARNGNYYSSAYSLEFSEIPEEIQSVIQIAVPIARFYFQGDVVIRHPYLWRNHFIPENLRSKETYSDAFHQDLVVDQFNLQLLILLHDVTVDHGPFIYLTPTDQVKYLNETKSRLSNLNYPGIPFVGKRGDAILFSTGYTLHRASSPAAGFHRDIMSIAFFPAYAGTDGETIDNISKRTL
jgi:hypothetical protein